MYWLIKFERGSRIQSREQLSCGRLSAVSIISELNKEMRTDWLLCLEMNCDWFKFKIQKIKKKLNRAVSSSVRLPSNRLWARTNQNARIINSYSSRTRRIWADIYNQRGRRPSWLLSGHIRQVREEYITVLVNFQAILLISSGETSNRDIFFTDDAANKFFPTSKISAQEIRHQFFLIWSNLMIMAHIMGLGN